MPVALVVKDPLGVSRREGGPNWSVRKAVVPLTKLIAEYPPSEPATLLHEGAPSDSIDPLSCRPPSMMLGSVGCRAILLLNCTLTIPLLRLVQEAASSTDFQTPPSLPA